MCCPRVDVRCWRMCGAAAGMFDMSMAWVEGSLRCGERARSPRRSNSREWRWRGSKQTLRSHGIVKESLSLQCETGRKRTEALDDDVVVVDPTFSQSRAAIADRGPASRCRSYVAYWPCIQTASYNMEVPTFTIQNGGTVATPLRICTLIGFESSYLI